MALRTVRITWLDSTGRAACLGLDETIETDWTIEECRKAAIYRAECEGIDLQLYTVEVTD